MPRILKNMLSDVLKKKIVKSVISSFNRVCGDKMEILFKKINNMNNNLPIMTFYLLISSSRATASFS